MQDPGGKMVLTLDSSLVKLSLITGVAGAAGIALWRLLRKKPARTLVIFVGSVTGIVDDLVKTAKEIVETTGVKDLFKKIYIVIIRTTEDKRYGRGDKGPFGGIFEITLRTSPLLGVDENSLLFNENEHGVVGAANNIQAGEQLFEANSSLIGKKFMEIRRKLGDIDVVYWIVGLTGGTGSAIFMNNKLLNSARLILGYRYQHLITIMPSIRDLVPKDGLTQADIDELRRLKYNQLLRLINTVKAAGWVVHEDPLMRLKNLLEVLNNQTFRSAWLDGRITKSWVILSNDPDRSTVDRCLSQALVADLLTLSKSKKVESRGDISNRKGIRVLRLTTASVLAETVTATGSSEGIITGPESLLDPNGRGCFPVLAIPYGAYHAFEERLTNDLREIGARVEDGAVALVRSRMMVPIIALYWSVNRDELDLISLAHGITPRPPVEEQEEQEITMPEFFKKFVREPEEVEGEETEDVEEDEEKQESLIEEEVNQPLLNLEENTQNNS